MAGNKNSGRRPLPDAVKKARGTFRKDRARGDDVTDPTPSADGSVPMVLASAEPGARPPPDFLDAVGLEEWHRVVPALEKLRVLADVDYSALEQYCFEHQTAVAAATALSKKNQPLMKRGAMGSMMPNPLIKIGRDARMAALKIAQEFGLTPSSRSKVKIPAPDKAPPEVKPGPTMGPAPADGDSFFDEAPAAPVVN